MSLRVKICGITSAEDAHAAVEAGADALGFNFYARSPRYVTPALAKSIIESLPAEILSVGVFVNEESPGAVGRLAEASGVAAVQLHGDESPEYCAALGGREVIKALRVGESFAPEEAARYAVGAILLDSFKVGARGGTGETFDWRLARRARDLVARLYLAGGLSPANVSDAVRAVRPYAVDVCSGVELAPGRKGPELMRRFVAAARAADDEARRADAEGLDAETP